MAKISIMRPPRGTLLFYNIDAAVGPGAPNWREDVLLVQYFLNEAIKGDSEFPPLPGGPLVVNGVANPETFAAIRHYQKEVKARGKPILTDGRVEPAVNDQHIGLISDTQYTIVYLNTGYSHARPQDFPRLAKAADCPGELRKPLAEPKFISGGP